MHIISSTFTDNSHTEEANQQVQAESSWSTSVTKESMLSSFVKMPLTTIATVNCVATGLWFHLDEYGDP